MARETLTASGRFAAALATPAMNGTFFEWRDPAGSAASTAGSFPANYPNTWLRLNRVGNTFTGYASYDGQTWTQLGSDTISMPNQIYLGFAVSSHNTNQPTTAQFLDFANVTNAVVGTRDQSARRHRAEQPHDADCVFGNHVETRAAHGREESGVSRTLQFQSVVSGHQRLSNHLRGHELHVPGRTRRFPAAVISWWPRRRRTSTSVYGITNVMGPYTGSLKHSETLRIAG